MSSRIYKYNKQQCWGLSILRNVLHFPEKDETKTIYQSPNTISVYTENKQVNVSPGNL